MGALEKKVVPFGEGITVRDTANFILAFVRLVIDGLEAGKFLTMIKENLVNLQFSSFQFDFGNPLVLDGKRFNSLINSSMGRPMSDLTSSW